MWELYALLSALFAALTAIFAKIAVRDVDSKSFHCNKDNCNFVSHMGLPLKKVDS